MRRRQRPRGPKSATRVPTAQALSDPKFRQRVVKAKKGKGSYSRKGRQVYPGALSFCLTVQQRYAPISSIKEARVTVARF